MVNGDIFLPTFHLLGMRQYLSSNSLDSPLVQWTVTSSAQHHNYLRFGGSGRRVGRKGMSYIGGHGALGVVSGRYIVSVLCRSSS